MSNRFTRASTPDRALQETLEQLIYRIEVLERKVSAGVLRGTTAPVISDGADNDWWLDVTNARLYGPKGITTAGTWDATFLGMIGNPTAFTTTVTQGVAIAKTSFYSEYIRLGQWVLWFFILGLNSAGTASSVVTCTLPVTASGANNIIGGFNYLDLGNTNYGGLVVGTSATTIAFQPASANNSLGPFGAMAVANGDVLRGWALYDT